MPKAQEWRGTHLLALSFNPCGNLFSSTKNNYCSILFVCFLQYEPWFKIVVCFILFGSQRLRLGIGFSLESEAKTGTQISIQYPNPKKPNWTFKQSASNLINPIKPIWNLSFQRMVHQINICDSEKLEAWQDGRLPKDIQVFIKLPIQDSEWCQNFKKMYQFKCFSRKILVHMVRIRNTPLHKICKLHRGIKYTLK